MVKQGICYLGCRYDVRALIDSASEGTFITERLFNKLKLPFVTTYATISGLNNSISANSSKQCECVLSSSNNNSLQIPTSALVVRHLSGNLPSMIIPKEVIDSLPSVDLADPYFYNGSHVDILTGGNLFPSIMLKGYMNNIPGSLLVQETIFG